MSKAYTEGHSNIALIKYWGKRREGRDAQLPLNASLSFTLKKALTRMEIAWEEISSPGEFIVDSLYLDNNRKENFRRNLQQKLDRLKASELFSWRTGAKLSIHSTNTFPHSSGIASSASSMCAIASFLSSFLNQTSKDSEVSLARQLSGSAGRSCYSGFVLWDHYEVAPLNSSAVDPFFKQLKDAILIVDSSAKKVSSTDGHAQMQSHPFISARIQQAAQHLSELQKSLRCGDFTTFARVVEAEALSLHALMMTSANSFWLLKPNTLKILEKIRNARAERGWKMAFTLDAGPNVHLLYDGKQSEVILDWVQRELAPYLEDGKYLDDEIWWGEK